LRINGRWGNYTPDICVISPNTTLDPRNSIEDRYLENFIECKHMVPYPMSCASFVGILYVLNRWNRNNRKNNRRFPAMVFYSGISPNSSRLIDLRNYLQSFP